MNPFTVVKYRIRYWWRKTIKALGLCPDCWNVLNYTTKGRPICLKCGK